MADPVRVVPRGLEKPMPIMFLTLVEWAVMMGGFGLGIVMRQFLLGMIIGFGFIYLYRKLTATAKRGMFAHAFWRAGLPSDPLILRYWPKSTAVDLSQ